jgi:hypothetical protein
MGILLKLKAVGNWVRSVNGWYIVGTLTMSGVAALLARGFEPAIIFLMALAAATMTIWLIRGALSVLMSWEHQRLTRKPNYENWDQVEHLALWMVAPLWIGVEPYNPLDAGTPAYPILQMLKSEAMSGNLGLAKVYGGTDQWERYSRSALRALAERKNQRPPAFFPEDR